MIPMIAIQTFLIVTAICRIIEVNYFPEGFIDKNGNRMEWDDSAIGQRSWDDL